MSIYNFGLGKADGDVSMRNILGGKGANLADMSRMGINIPPGFTISTAECNLYYTNGNALSEEIRSKIKGGVKFIEDAIGKSFGASDNPLLVSVRSGAPVSMPGMMDTVLNLGLNDITVANMAKSGDRAKFVYDSYRRFIQMYSNVVLGMHGADFDTILEDIKNDHGVINDSDLDESALQTVIEEYKAFVQKSLGHSFPQDPYEQLFNAISAVFASWQNDRAIYYRKMHNISADLGTAVNIQSMVFGNLNNNSATGVSFTRNPSTGEKKIYGEYLVNAQGEDVVAGIRTPNSISGEGDSLENVMPSLYQEFVEISNKLEHHYKDMQDIEFTIEDKKLYILQTRNGKRTAMSAIKIAYDMYQEGLISKEEALLKIDPETVTNLLHPQLNATGHEAIAKGLPASPGAASGKIAMSTDKVKALNNLGFNAILVRLETSPEDIEGMHISKGILTARGGMTSHAAVVARGMGKTCITGCGSVVIGSGEVKIGNETFKEEDDITIDGASGMVYKGQIPTRDPEIFPEFNSVLEWAMEAKKLNIRTNADNSKDLETAIKYGAEGIGLCRTEHMFFSKDRIREVRKMILAANTEERSVALDKILPFQVEDFKSIFETANGLPINIRLLDPPLHEFLPHENEQIEEIAEYMGVSKSYVEGRIRQLTELNPMLGHRGCRLGITYPEIYDMQVRAIFNAASSVANHNIEIMVPLILSQTELQIFRKRIHEISEEFSGVRLNYQVGTMIELPRACIVADKIAESADYFSFGTNDLTQMTMGLSRDDSGAFISDYEDAGIFESDPFNSIDEEGVGFLVKHAVTLGRSVKSNLKTGVCGEHGGDPKSIHFFHNAGLTYASCSPFRVPVAIIAAAQANIKGKK